MEDAMFEKHIRATQDILDEKFKMGTISNMYIPEILEGLEAIVVFGDRVAALKKNSDRSLNTVLYYAFKQDRPILTAKEVLAIEYKPSHEADDISISPMNLYDTAKRLYIFDSKTITVAHMIKMATEILENLHPSEAEVFKGIFTQKMPYKNITKKLVETAFPDLFAGEEPEEVEEVDEAAVLAELEARVAEEKKVAAAAAKAKATTKKPAAKKETK